MVTATQKYLFDVYISHCMFFITELFLWGTQRKADYLCFQGYRLQITLFYVIMCGIHPLCSYILSSSKGQQITHFYLFYFDFEH